MASPEDNAYRRELVAKRESWLSKARAFRKRGERVEARVMMSMAADVSRRIRAFDRYESQTRRLVRKAITKLRREL